MKTRSERVRCWLASVAALAAAAPLSAATWNGGSATTNNWMDAANWGGVAPVPPAALIFDGNARTNPNNDFPAGTTFNGITFAPTAGVFILGGNGVTLGGSIANNSPLQQGIVIPLRLAATTIINGGAGGLGITNSITNTNATGTVEITLSGTNSSLTGPFVNQTAGAGLRLNVNSTSDTDTWSILSNASSAITGQLFVTHGTLTYGSAADAPSMTINRTDGGFLAEFLTIGNVAGGGGTFNMVNGSLILNSQDNLGGNGVRFALGNGSGGGSTGTFNQTGGTITFVGFKAGTTPGVFNANKTGSSTQFNVSGGTFDAGVTDFFATTRGVGVVTVSDTGVLKTRLLNLNRANGGPTASGTFNLNGGTVTVGGITRSGTVAANGTAIFNFNGGTLKFAGSGTWDNNADITAMVKSSGAFIDTTGFNITIMQPLTHDTALGSTPDGGLTKNGNGTLTLAGANTYTGPTTVNGGSLVVSGSQVSSGMTITPGTTLGGSGTLAPTGLIEVKGGGILAPGASIGTLTLDSINDTSSLFQLDAGATLSFELNNVLLSDRVSLVNGAAGDIAFANNTINFSDLAAGTLAPGSYTLFSADIPSAYTGLTTDGANSITAGLLIGTGLSAYPGSALQVSGNNIVLNIPAVPEPTTLALLSIVAPLLARRRLR